MKPRTKQNVKILALDIGGNHVRCPASGRARPLKRKSWPKLTPEQKIEAVLKSTASWHYDAVSIG